MIPSDGTDPGAAPRTGGAPAPDSRGTGSSSSHHGPSGHTLSPEQFGAQFEACWRILWCAAVAVVRDRSLAQDVVQQAAVVGLEHLSDFDARTSFVSWMVRIVKNIALNESRKHTRRRTHPTEVATLDARSGSAATAGPAASGAVIDSRGGVMAGQPEFDDQVVRALDGLDDTARGCLLLRVVLSLSYREIALAMNVPEGTAASHVHRARKAMRDALRDRFTAVTVRGVRA